MIYLARPNSHMVRSAMNEAQVHARPVVPVQIVAGRILLWATLAVGVATNAVEAFFAIGGLLVMARGSCSAALAGLVFGLPLVPLEVVLFVVGAALARWADPRALTTGVTGLALSLVAAPLWYFVAFGAVSVFRLA
jgi:hypothetical protein